MHTSLRGTHDRILLDRDVLVDGGDHFLHICLLLFKVLSLGSRPGQRYVLVVFLVCLVCCCCSCLFVVVEITLFKNCRFGIALNP